MNIVCVQVYRGQNRSGVGGNADQSWPYRPVHRSAGPGRQYREQGLRVQGCLRFSVKQVRLQEWKTDTQIDRGVGVGVCLSLKESQDVKCAGAVSAAVFRGESTR